MNVPFLLEISRVKRWNRSLKIVKMWYVDYTYRKADALKSAFNYTEMKR